MKLTRVLTIVFAISMLQACGGNQEKPEVVKGDNGQKIQKADSFTNIEAKDLNEVLKSESGDVVLLDVRTPGEIAGGKIAADAVEFDFYEEDFQSNLESLDKNKKIYVYCKAGGRSSSAAKMLIDKGFKEVYNLNGGITAWQGSGFELSK